MTQDAEKFAIKAHGDQKYGKHPYIDHLRQTVAVLKRFGVTDQDILTAGLLHDVLEDTNTQKDYLASIFGEEITGIVYAVTDEKGKTRRERHEKTYPKTAANKKGVIVKLADRIANVENCIKEKSDLLGMYKKEYAGFKSALYTAGENQEMWDHLDKLFEGK